MGGGGGGGAGGGGGGGGGGGYPIPQYRIRKNGKYRNTMSKMNEIPIPHL